MNDQFRASVQYNDLVGSSAADRADKGGPEDWLLSKKLKQLDEFVIGIEVWAGENPGVHRDPVTVQFLLVQGGFDSVKDTMKNSAGPISTRRVPRDMSMAEFMGLFKRFSICLSPGGMLNGKRLENILSVNKSARGPCRPILSVPLAR